MVLRRSFAAILQLMRTRRGLSQHELATTVTQSHISQLEASKTSPTLEVSQELSKALSLHPLTFLTLIHAAEGQIQARELLKLVTSELESIEMLDAAMPTNPESQQPPQSAAAARKRIAVQDLKAQGRTQTEASQILKIPKSTIGRYWR